MREVAITTDGSGVAGSPGTGWGVAALPAG